MFDKKPTQPIRPHTISDRRCTRCGFDEWQCDVPNCDPNSDVSRYIRRGLQDEAVGHAIFRSRRV
jgi:hypothetical protein